MKRRELIYDSDIKLDEDNSRPPARTEEKKGPFLLSLSNYAKLGFAASLILGLVELIDVHYQLAPAFRSLSDRLAFSAYFSLNLLSGLLIGTLVALCAQIATGSYKLLLKLVRRHNQTTLRHQLVAWVGVSVLASAILNQIPFVHRYTFTVAIEAQKLPFIYSLIEHRQIASYLMLFGLIIAGSAVYIVTQNVGATSRLWRAIWVSGLLVVITAAYYIDSRVEVGLYEYSLHRSMFLLASAIAMAFFGTLYILLPRLHALVHSESSRKKALTIAATALLIGLVGFTFLQFDRDQNLKAQVLTRTTQVKQHFMLARWLLDYDRDGYSAFLGGGDADDTSADIAPVKTEIAADGIDNNCIGGDLTAEQIEEWKQERTRLNVGVNRQQGSLNVIYIFIDAVRAGHLSAYGYHRETSPNIDRLAARSAVFENAFSPSANTFESVPKFMQSCYWDAHQETWTEVLTRFGYETYLFPAHRFPMLRRYVRGVNVVEEARGKRLDETIDIAIGKLGSRTDRPFMAYIYIPEPHSPYKRHGDFSFGASPMDRYDGEIAYTDYHLGRLFSWMEETGRLDNTTIVIMSDHGESFGERMVYRHSSQLYNDQTHIPMICYVPGIGHRRIADYVSSIDLGPTILNAAGIDIPQSYLGVSLVPLMKGEPFDHPAIFGEQRCGPSDAPNLLPEENPYPAMSKYMIVSPDGYKLIYDQRFYTFELFDLKNDPREENNLYSRGGSKAEELKQQLGRFVDIVTASRPWDADETRFLFGRDENREPWVKTDY